MGGGGSWFHGDGGEASNDVTFSMDEGERELTRRLIYALYNKTHLIQLIEESSLKNKNASLGGLILCNFLSV